MKYKNIYFDLDRTLWDFESNARAAFKDLYTFYDLEGRIPDPEKFFERFNFHSEILWEGYRKGKVRQWFLRVERFRLALADFGIEDEELAAGLSRDYLSIAPHKTHLVAGAEEVLSYLSEQYSLFIITNGFYEVQMIKLEKSGLGKYFKRIFTSDKLGVQKPRKGIFEYAIKSVHSRKKESIMVGDDLTVDILGARNAGIDQIYYNPAQLPHKEKITYEIRNLYELKEIL